MPNKHQKKPITFAKKAWGIASTATGVMIATSSTAFAADTTIDLTTGLAGVAVIGGLMASGTLKALPTYTAWGIRKALSMLR